MYDLSIGKTGLSDAGFSFGSGRWIESRFDRNGGSSEGFGEVAVSSLSRLSEGSHDRPIESSVNDCIGFRFVDRSSPLS